MDKENLLPIRVVQPSRDFLQKDKRKDFPKIKFFIPESEIEEHTNYLMSNLDTIDEKLKFNFEKYPIIPNIIKAKLKPEAFAKSHRPKDLLDIDTCPIVGIDQLGELLLSTTRTGLLKLKNKIKTSENNKVKANITAIDRIESFGIKERLLGLDPSKLESLSKRNGETYLKLILFDHQDEEINKLTTEEFIVWIEELGLNIEPVSNLKNVKIFKIMGANEEKIIEIGNHPSVRTLSFFPLYKMIKPTKVDIERVISSFPRPEEYREYARIGIIDTGIPHEHPILAPWVVEHLSFVHDNYADNYHGSFVGGLASLGHHLNGASICPDEDQIKLIDVQVLGNNNPQFGEIEEVSEDILMVRLEEAIPYLTKKHNVRIWNMSAGLSVPCEQQRFSNLATFLDELQDECGIIFTLPSGNFVNKNGEHRTWPPQPGIDHADYLEVPGDSVRAITVGAIACAEKPGSCVKINEPTSYSRRGPGPSYTIKPDLVHYSGNFSLSPSGNINLMGQGIRSFDENGGQVEDVGTSFSTPLIARTGALLHNSLLPEPSMNLIKALMIHHSYLPKELGKPEKIMPYTGFGMPPSLKRILSCSEHEITLIFEQEITSGFTLDYPFLWPPSLKNNKAQCKGNVRMTLVAEPPLDSSFGAEYIRANLEASLQAGNGNAIGELQWIRKIQENPSSSDLKKRNETELIEHGFKWKPIKKYEKTLHRVKAEDWRIRVRLLLRDGFDLGSKPIKFALIFTISDPDKKYPIYDEIINGLRQRNVFTNEIQFKSQIKQRVENIN